MRTRRSRIPIKMGIPGIDSFTGGVKPGELWVISGEACPETDFFLLRCCMGAMANKASCHLMSMEFTVHQIGFRFVAMLAQVSYQGYLRGRLSAFAVRQVREELAHRQQRGLANLRFLPPTHRDWTEYLFDMLAEDLPDVLFLHGANLLRENGPTLNTRAARLAENLHKLKHIAFLTGIPIVCSCIPLNSIGIVDGLGDQLRADTVTTELLINQPDTMPIFLQPGDVSHRRVEVLSHERQQRAHVFMKYNLALTRIEEEQAPWAPSTSVYEKVTKASWFSQNALSDVLLTSNPLQ